METTAINKEDEQVGADLEVAKQATLHDVEKASSDAADSKSHHIIAKGDDVIHV